MKKYIIYIILGILFFGLMFFALTKDKKKESNDNLSSGLHQVVEDAKKELDKVVEDKKKESNDNMLSGLHHVVITVKDYGNISLELDASTAPITVTNFVELVKSKFYDGLTFHRIMEGFMIQGGDPEGTGFGGSKNKIKGEFKSNGVENNISHKRGVISMARGAYDKNSASSQFFIVHEDSEFLDGDYAAFGHVTEGMEVVDKIASDAKPTDDNGTIKASDQPVITKIEFID